MSLRKLQRRPTGPRVGACKSPERLSQRQLVLLLEAGLLEPPQCSGSIRGSTSKVGRDRPKDCDVVSISIARSLDRRSERWHGVKGELLVLQVEPTLELIHPHVARPDPNKVASAFDGGTSETGR